MRRSIFFSSLILTGISLGVFAHAYSLRAGGAGLDGIPANELHQMVSNSGLSSLEVFAVGGDPAAAKEPDFWEIKGKLGKVEFAMGNGFMARGTSIINHDLSYIHDSKYMDLKFRPYDGERRMEALNLQLGLHYSSGVAADPTQPYACTENTFNSKFNQTCTYDGPKYFAFYGGGQAELVELVAREPRPTQVLVGAGFGHIAPSVPEGNLFPYASAEVSYRLSKRLQTKGGVFLSAFPGVDQVGVAATSVVFEYHF